MLPTRQGSFRLFRLWGIDVHLHWSWFILAFYSISQRLQNYHSPIWGALEYLALFLIVLTHEFGHALASRQVGGHADQIVLWPFGGVAYVAAPPRPGATLWSIAAGPLVNVVLLPVLFGLAVVDRHLGWGGQFPDLHIFIRAVAIMNLTLLCFNLLPVYPLDGGQILRALLWYPFGRARSLFIATVIGFLGGAALVGVAVWLESMWIGFIAFFLLSNCWRSFQQARILLKIAKLPSRPGFACRDCGAAPPLGNYWRCKSCSALFDPFATGGVCPQCQAVQDATACVQCGAAHPVRSWGQAIREA
jgi:Zn-dependent protease